MLAAAGEQRPDEALTLFEGTYAMLKPWKRTDTVVIHKNPWWSYQADDFEIPGRYRGKYYYVHTNGSSMVIPLTEDGRMILVNQYRYLWERQSLEFPCGCVKDGHSHAQTARLELEEETGYRAGRIVEVGRYNPYNGVTDEVAMVFVATELEQVTARPDATEEFELVRCTVGQFEQMVRQRHIWDGMTLSAWMLAEEQVLELIGA